MTDSGRSPASGVGLPPASRAEPMVSGKAGIPNAAELWTQLYYPEAAEALAEAIGPLILEEFDCEPRGVEWRTISALDKITIRFIAKSGIDRLKNHCRRLAGRKVVKRANKANSDGSLTIGNASVQRLLDYGLLHYTDEGYYVGPWPVTNTPSRDSDTRPKDGDKGTLGSTCE